MRYTAARSWFNAAQSPVRTVLTRPTRWFPSVCSLLLLTAVLLLTFVSCAQHRPTLLSVGAGLKPAPTRFCDETAVPPNDARALRLIDRVNRGTPAERISAASDLACMGPAVLPAVRNALASTTPQGAPVLMGLVAQWGDRDALPILERSAETGNGETALAAVECLGRLNAVPALEAIIRDEGRPMGFRVAAVRALGLGKPGGESERFLLALLDSPCSPLAAEAIGSLRFQGSQSYRSFLPGLLFCDDRMLSTYAASFLRGKAPPPEFHPLKNMVTEEPESSFNETTQGEEQWARVAHSWREDVSLLRKAARTQSMDIDSLHLPNRPLDVPDRFRLPFVERLLASPFSAVEEALAFAAASGDSNAPSSLSPARALAAAHQLLNDQPFSRTESSAQVQAVVSFSEAILDAFRRARQSPSNSDIAVLKDFDSRIPKNLSLALGGLFRSLAFLRETWEQGLAPLSPDELQWLETTAVRMATPGGELNRDERMRFGALAARPDWKIIRAAEASALSCLETAMAELRKPDSLRMLSEAPFPLHVATPAGAVAIYGPGADTISTSGILVIDTGGNDRIECAAGSAVDGRRVSVYLDADGDDRYEWNDGPAFGSGILGTGILADLRGNDTYRSARFSQGAALLGTGLLYDHEGNDTYESGFMSQGAASCGTGILMDEAGDDSYLVGCTGQGFGGPGGAGMLMDGQGNDRYRALGGPADAGRDGVHSLSMSQGFGLGIRSEPPLESFGAFSGGVGLLYDLQGDDCYELDTFGQGAGYFFGAGLLVDTGGNDRYAGYNYVQGAGIHSAFGLLLDEEGNDRYLGSHHCTGSGLDRGLGILFDLAGDDSYRNGTDCQGAGVKPFGLGILADHGGDDDYTCGLGRGYARTPELWPGGWPTGLFLDRSGRDVYDGQKSRNGFLWYRPRRGLGVDAD